MRSECPLGQLLAREAALGREIRALDSDMQTLLYENYNKFISATGELFLLEPADCSNGKWGFGDVHSGSTGKLLWGMWWFPLETNDSLFWGVMVGVC